MTKKYSTKRALLSSVLALLLCLSTFVGTTFAWFTDSVTSANNVIQSGTLDIELYHQDAKLAEPAKVGSETKLFDEVTEWEPGVMVWEEFTIANEGNLALKYQFALNVLDATVVDGVSFTEVLKVAVVEDGLAEYSRAAVEAITEWEDLATFVDDGELAAEATETFAIIIWWQPSEDDNRFNFNNGKAGTAEVTLGVNLFATQASAESDAFGSDYDANAMTFVKNAAEAQAALDNAESGATIKLAPGVNYGTLVFRQTASSTVVDITTAGGDAPGNEKYRRIEDLTIIGAEGAVVDGFDFQVGWIDGSGASFIDVENLTVKGVTFSGEATPFNFEGAKGSALGIDGLTIVDCKMNDANGNNRFVFQQISGYKELNDKTAGEYVMTTGIKNLTITECEVVGAYMVIESRAMENLTITNNTFKGIKARDMLITSDTTYYANTTYTGTITITGNTSIGGEERFIRGSLNNSDAVVVIKDNTIVNYMGADADYIKVTGANNVTIENNTLVSIGVKDAAAAQAALDNAVAGTTIQLQPGVDYGTLYLRPYEGGAATKTVDWIGNNYGWETYTLFENLTIIGADGATVDAIEIEGGTYYHTDHSQDDTYPVMLSLVELKNVVIDGVTFTGNGGYDPQGHGNVINLSGHNIKIDGLTLKDCVLDNAENNARLIYKTESTTHVHNYAYDGATYTFSPTLKNITVTGCTFNGGYMGLELRETENLTITNNIFNVADRNMLLPVNTGCTYSGTITITGNVSNNAQERFVRGDGFGDAVAVIKDNTIVNYMGADADYIKVTGANNLTVENNTITYGAKDNATFANALKIASDGSTITLISGGDYSLLAIPKDASAKNITVKAEEGVKVGAVYQIGCGYCTGGILAMPENLTFDGITFDGQIGELANGNFCTCTHAITDIDGLSGFLTRWSKANGLTFNDCEFVNGAAISLSYGGSKNLVVDGCTFKDTVSSAVSAYATNGVTVTGCTMENIGFAAIFAGDESQNIVFENNTVTSTGSRIIRLNKLTTGTTVTVKGNTFGVANTDPAEAADNNGQIVKISASVSAIVTFEDNTYNGAAFPEVITTDSANWVAVAN